MGGRRRRRISALVVVGRAAYFQNERRRAATAGGPAVTGASDAEASAHRAILFLPLPRRRAFLFRNTWVNDEGGVVTQRTLTELVSKAAMWNNNAS